MTKKILVISSDELEKTWLEYLDEIASLGYHLELRVCDPELFGFSQENAKKTSQLKFFLTPNNKLFSFFFFVLRPFLFFCALAFLLYKKNQHGIGVIICFGLFEKLHFTRAAKLVGLKTLWVMNSLPDKSLPAMIKSSLSRVSKHAQTICLSDYWRQKLQNDNSKIKNVSLVKFGISDRRQLEQKNIFEKLAHANTRTNDKKFFTIGTIQNLTGNIDHLEMLLHALKNSKQLIPHIQLVVVGDGPERKNLSWMAKKMEIADLIWFVGDHKHYQKWLSNFDVFISTTPRPGLSDINSALMASLSSLSVIAPEGVGYDEFIIDGKTGLLKNIDDSQELSRAIIELQQNPQKRAELGKNGRHYIQENFQLSQSIKQVTALLEA